MPLSHIEHLLVAADDIDATRDWYARVLGMRSGPHPDFGFPVHWMYLGDVDIVHIGPSAKMAGENQKKYLGRTSQGGVAGTGAIDHIAFRATGLRQMLAHLKSEQVPFSQRRAPIGIGLLLAKQAQHFLARGLIVDARKDVEAQGARLTVSRAGENLGRHFCG